LLKNHRSATHSTVCAIYDRYRYDKEKRAALERWAAVLTEIVGTKPAPTAAVARPIARANGYEFSLTRPIAHRRASADAGLRTLRSPLRVMRKSATPIA